MTDPAILLENVTKQFGRGHTAVRALCGVSLSLPQGLMAVIAGPSGSGKSTLLGIVGALEKPTSGRVIVQGQEISRMSERTLSRHRRARVGFVFQEFNLISDLTARENIEFPLRLNGSSPAERASRADTLIERLGLGDRRNAFPIELSAGERQRVAIARAVAHHPAIILADEPTANLDSANAREVLAVLRELQQAEGISVLLATHDPAIIASVDHAVFLKDGAVDSLRKLS